MTASLSRYQHTRCCRLGWLFERAGWVSMAAVTVAAGVGVFGRGWLSAAETRRGPEVTMRYERFARAHAPFELSVEWRPQQLDAALSFERAYLEHFAIEEMQPPPAAVTVGRERFHYSFRVSEGALIAIRFRLRPARSGRFVGAIGVDDGAEVEIRQYVFP